MNRSFLFIDYRFGEYETYCKKGLREVNINSEKQYYFEGSYWIKFEPYKDFEGYILLVKVPILPFEITWDIFIKPQNDDEKIGAISVIIKVYREELKYKLTEILNNMKIDDRTIKRLRSFKKEVIAEMEPIIGLLGSENYWGEIDKLLKSIVGTR